VVLRPDLPWDFTPFSFLLSRYHSGEAMKIEEYVPLATPTMSGRAKSLMELGPIKYNNVIVISVVRDVFIDLVNVWEILVFISSSRLIFFL
jgi:hypothetical protein